MHASRFGLVLTLAAAFSLHSGAPARADLYWESEQVVKNIPGQKDSTRIIKNYITSAASRTDMGDSITIVKYDDMTLYQLNPAEKTYIRIDMKALGIPLGGDDKDEERTARTQSLIQEMLGKIQVVPSDETRTISGYLCRRYDLNFMMVKTEYWTSDEVDGYEEIAAAGKKLQKAFEGNPMLKNADLLGIMGSLPGFPVQVVNRMMGGTSTTTLKKIEQKTLPKSLFEIPKGYQRIEAPSVSTPPPPLTPQMPARPAPAK